MAIGNRKRPITIREGRSELGLVAANPSAEVHSNRDQPGAGSGIRQKAESHTMYLPRGAAESGQSKATHWLSGDERLDDLNYFGCGRWIAMNNDRPRIRPL